MKRKRLICLGILCFLLLIPVPILARAVDVEEYPLTYRIDKIDLATFKGTVAWRPIRYGDRPRVVVEKEADEPASRRVRQFLRSIVIDNMGSGSELKLRAVQPDLPPGITSAAVHFTVYARSDQFESFNAKTNGSPIYIDADFDCSLALSTNDAPIVIRSGRGKMALITSNAPIELGRLHFTDSSTIQTSNSSIDGTAVFSAQGLFVFQTSNGPINLRLPADTRGTLNLITSVGTIDLRLGRDIVSNQQIAVLHRGSGPIIHVMTSNSDITIREAYRY